MGSPDAVVDEVDDQRPRSAGSSGQARAESKAALEPARGPCAPSPLPVPPRARPAYAPRQRASCRGIQLRTDSKLPGFHLGIEGETHGPRQRVPQLSAGVWPTGVDVVMTSRQALAFIRKHGIVLESAQGSAPSLASVIAGEPVRGSWWSHPRGREIFAVTRAIRDSEEVLVCRLGRGKVTFVHRRLWPALVRSAGWLPADHLSRVREEHTSTGRHVSKEVPFPDWVPPSVRSAARSLSEEEALAEFAAWIE